MSIHVFRTDDERVKAGRSQGGKAAQESITTEERQRRARLAARRLGKEGRSDRTRLAWATRNREKEAADAEAKEHCKCGELCRPGKGCRFVDPSREAAIGRMVNNVQYPVIAKAAEDPFAAQRGERLLTLPVAFLICKYKGCGKSRHVYPDGRINKQFCTEHVELRKEQAAKCRGKS